MPKTHPDPDFRKGFAGRLKTLRSQRGWTQKELADKLGVQMQQIVRYEAGHQLPPAETIVELSEILERTTDYLLTGDSAEAPPLHNMRLIERLRALQSVSAKHQDTAIEVLDAILIRDRAEAAVRPPDESTNRDRPKRRVVRKVMQANQ
jgi:transcriptional regulator with XRE-family HTH domain